MGHALHSAQNGTCLFYVYLVFILCNFLYFVYICMFYMCVCVFVYVYVYECVYLYVCELLLLWHILCIFLYKDCRSVVCSIVSTQKFTGAVFMPFCID